MISILPLLINMYYLSIPGFIITEDGLIPLTDEQKEDLIEEDS